MNTKTVQKSKGPSMINSSTLPGSANKNLSKSTSGLSQNNTHYDYDPNHIAYPDYTCL